MTKGLRWRVVVLQVGLMGILSFAAGFAFWGSSFSTGQVHDNLAAQQIYFPAANSPAITALPVADATAMRVYAGQQLTTGPQAETYADHFIKVHLNEMAAWRRSYSTTVTKAPTRRGSGRLTPYRASAFAGNRDRPGAVRLFPV